MTETLPPPPPPPPPPGSFDDRERQLEASIIVVWRVMSGVTSAFPLAVLSVVAALVIPRHGWIAPLAGLTLLVSFIAWYPTARYARWRWRLTDLALELKHGVFVHTHETVPYFRVQQIDITQGPLERALHLATLLVTSASASGSAAIPGISADLAPQLRRELLARASAALAEHPQDSRDAV